MATGAEAEPWAEKGPEGAEHKAVRAGPTLLLDTA